MNRRTFLKKGSIFVPATILLPTIIKAKAEDIAVIASLQANASAGGSETPWITSNPATSWRNNHDGCLGSLFTTDGTARTITHLGLYVKSGNTATTTVKILNGLTEITSAVFNQTGMPEGWNYISVTPVSLPASTSLAIARTSVNGGAGDNWPDDWLPTTSGITSSFSSAYNTNPSCDDESNFTSVTSNGMFAGVNFKYTTP